MCSCKRRKIKAPPPPEFTAQESGGVNVLVGAKADAMLISPTVGKVHLKPGKTAPFPYNEARSFKQSGAPIWITESVS